MHEGRKPENGRRRHTGWALLGLCLGVSVVGSIPARAQEDPAKQKISLNLVDADVRDAIALIFKDTPLNHVIAEGVYGTVPQFRVENMEREKVLKTLLESRGLQYTVEGGVYMIKPKAGGMTPGMGAGAPGMMGPGGMMPGAQGMPALPAAGGARPAAAPGAPGTTTGAQKGELVAIRLRNLDPWYAVALLAGQMGGGMGGGGFGGFGGTSSYGGFGGGFGGGGFGGGFGGGGFGNSFGGGGFGGGGFGNSFGGGGFGGGGFGNSFGGGGFGGGGRSSFGGGGFGGGGRSSFGGGTTSRSFGGGGGGFRR